MIKYDKNYKTIDLEPYNLKSEEIASLLEEINLTINNFKKQIKKDEIKTFDIFNSWLFQNPKWKKMPFSFYVEIYSYIETMKDESGIFLS